jgi:hypothetical protein
MVDGLLPDEDLGPGEIIYAQGAVDVQVAGSVKLLLNSPQGLKLWINDRPVSDLSAPLDLADGRIHMGSITYKSDKEVVIRDSAQGGKEVKLLMTEVRKMRPMPSLMPAGLSDQLKTRQEFLDLTKFISLLGRPGPYANDESPVIRKWKVAPGSDKPPASDISWVTAYSMVDGVLPDEDLGPDEIIYAQGAVDVQVAGSVKLQLNSSKGLKLWIDEHPVNDLSAPLELTAGRHTFTFVIQRDQRSASDLRVELTTPTGSPAKFQPEGGL